MDSWLQKDAVVRVVALILAFVMWLFVINENNPQDARTISVPPELRNLPAAVSYTHLDVYKRQALPGALPMIFAGFKLGMGTALLLIVAAELTAARAGVGYWIWRAYDMFDIERMFVALIMMSILGYLLSYLLDYIEQRVIPWKAPRP